MRSSIRVARVFGIELRIHYSWLFIALLITVSLATHFRMTNADWTPVEVWASAVITGILFFAGLFLHEMAHALVAKAARLPIHRITLFALGGMAQIEREPQDAKTEFWMAIVGPATSFVLGVLLLLGARATGWAPQIPPASPPTAVLVWLGYINIMLAAFNMIPGFPLDGGRVLRAIVWLVTKNARRSTRIASRTGQAVAALFIGWGIFRFFTGAGFAGLWLAIIGWFLMEAASSSLAQQEIARLLRGLRVRDLMSPDCATVPASEDLETLVNTMFLRTGRRCFLVTSNDRFLGLITPAEIRAVERDRWPLTRAAEAMRPRDQLKTVAPETPAKEALETMVANDLNQLPVVSDGDVQGMISRANILQVLQAHAELNRPPR